MKTHKKHPKSGGGWIAAVTMDDGSVLTVELIRGRVARNYFGNPSYHWSAHVEGPGWRHTLLARRDDSGRKLALRAVRAIEELDNGRGT